MSSLSTKVILYLEANGKTRNELGPSDASNVIIQKDSDNPKEYIRKWDIEGVPKPTDKQLDTYNSAGDAAEANVEVIRTRKSLYGTTAKQLEYITENGVAAFIARQNQIKTANPKA